MRDDSRISKAYISGATMTAFTGQVIPLSDMLISPIARQEMEGKTFFRAEDFTPFIDLHGKRTCVLGFGVSASWIALNVVRQGASRCDWAGLSGNPPGANDDNESLYRAISHFACVQIATAPNSGVHLTFDRVLSITSTGNGVSVTFAHTVSGKTRIYSTSYDVIIEGMTERGRALLDFAALHPENSL